MLNPINTVYAPLGSQVKFPIHKTPFELQIGAICWNCTGPLGESPAVIGPDRNVCECCAPLYFSEEMTGE